MPRRRLLAVLALALGLAAGATIAPAAAPRCFGAAARDRVRPCSNPTKTMVPSFDDRDVHSISPCVEVPVRQVGIGACAFGVSAARAADTVALVGDSHAQHWRGAMKVVAQALHWHGMSVTTGRCFFSAAVEHFLPDARERCTQWYRSVSGWFGDHPEVHTVFVSQNATTPVAVGPGETYFGIKFDGFRRAWTSLPKTVRHVVVIHDVPTSTNHTFDCVRDTVAAGETRPGPACPLPRSAALTWDTAISTVRRLHSGRYRSVDLTEFFCGRRSCYLVVGGVLVNSDLDHITGEFSRSLGPYLLRKIRRLMRSW